MTQFDNKMCLRCDCKSVPLSSLDIGVKGVQRKCNYSSCIQLQSQSSVSKTISVLALSVHLSINSISLFYHPLSFSLLPFTQTAASCYYFSEKDTCPNDYSTDREKVD